jgi:hypothetical protein
MKTPSDIFSVQGAYQSPNNSQTTGSEQSVMTKEMILIFSL